MKSWRWAMPRFVPNVMNDWRECAKTRRFVLVSHDTDQIARVCSTVLVLDRGARAISATWDRGFDCIRSSRVNRPVLFPMSMWRRGRRINRLGAMKQ